MKYIFVCNTAGDTLSKINLKDYSVESLPLELGEKPVGPHGIDYYNGNIITTNNYSNSISIFSLMANKEIKNIHVGAHPNDVKVFKDKAYVLCGESNSLVVVDLNKESMICEVFLGARAFPHSIEIYPEKDIAYISNMEGHSITVIDCLKNRAIDNIKAPEYPTKILLSKDKKKLYLCESYLGMDIDGYISVISTDSNEIVKRIKVGGSPVDIFEEDERLYITNFSEGYLSIVDLKKEREIKKIFVGGMPRGIIKYKEDIFIGNNMNGKVIKLNLKERIIKTITVGKEPNAMILVDYPQKTVD
ncbi:MULTISPECIES: YncE family protein [Clostridium]|uniref:YncE family protein n=1 Tax=Clostridium cibarium TaxID=2762247 RepID=A0ABR8PPS2_9CLOT|nr:MULTISPECIES: YncE family protein [Clostridium]MBD7910120.1 YncE family protein [Clostridium cibarium]